MTTKIIPVFTALIADETVQLCNARELHTTLQVGRDFATWIKERIEQYGFVEGEDFVIVSAPPIRGAGNRGKRTDYHLTLDMAKELAMVENNDIGREIRRYLIRLEKKAIAAGLKVDAVVNKAQLGEMSQCMADRFPVGKDRPYAWGRFNNHFRLASYKDLPAEKFAEAIAYIDQMPVKAQAITVNAETSPESLDALALRELTKPGVRFITIFGNSKGEVMPILYSIPENAFMLTDDEIIKRVGKPDGFPVDLIPALINAGVSRLQKRIAA